MLTMRLSLYFDITAGEFALMCMGSYRRSPKDEKDNEGWHNMNPHLRISIRKTVYLKRWETTLVRQIEHQSANAWLFMAKIMNFDMKQNRKVLHHPQRCLWQPTRKNSKAILP